MGGGGLMQFGISEGKGEEWGGGGLKCGRARYDKVGQGMDIF